MNNFLVLFVEDEVVLVCIMVNIFCGEQFWVIVVEIGDEVLELFCLMEFDICIVDVMIFGIDGYVLVCEICKFGSDILVIFFIVCVLKDDVIEGYYLGGNDYLCKFFSIEEFIVWMNELLCWCVQFFVLLLFQMQVGKYFFSLLCMELIYLQEIICLIYCENEIVFCLVSNYNEIVFICFVLFEFWGDDYYYNSCSLNVFVIKIWKYLWYDFVICIINVCFVGYWFVVIVE